MSNKHHHNFVISAISILTLLITHEALGDCLTPWGHIGECVNIKDCPKMRKMLDINPLPLTHEIMLHQAFCGIDGSNYKVCCAPGQIHHQSENTINITTESPDPRDDPNDTCTSLSNREGNCVIIKKCAKMMDVLSKRPLTEDNRSYLHRSHCGFEGIHPKVCCEIEDGVTPEEIHFPEVNESRGIGKTNTGDSCISSSGRKGNCVNIKKCQRMVKLLQETPLTQEIRNHLHQAKCGDEGNDPKVCCEIEDRVAPEEIHFPEVNESPGIGKNNTGDSCISSSGRKGNCVNIKKCQRMVMLLQKTPLTQEIRDHLRRAKCGDEGNYPKVCCEIEEDETEEEEKEEITSVETPSSPGEHCLTPWGRMGRCIRIDDCEDLKKLHRQDPLFPMHEKLLEIARCGPGGLRDPDFRVCCVIKQSNLERNSGTSEGIAESVIQRIPGKKSLKTRLLPHESCGPVPEARIFGGNDTGIHEFPWMALLGYEVVRRGVDYRCGGSLISEKYVLTAAHCVTAISPGIKLAKVRLGEYDMSAEEDCDSEGHCIGKYQEFVVEDTKPHENYSQQTFQNDIALVKLRSSVDIRSGTIRPICLPLDPPSSSGILRTPSHAVVTGWGATEHGTSSTRLQKVTLSILTNELCQKLYRQNKNVVISQRQLCAGGARDKDSCSGDSGGPLQAIGMYGKRPSFVQYGIVSYGHASCGVEGSPGIYTRVAHYVQWILDNMID